MTQMPPVQMTPQTVQPRRSGTLGIIAIVLAVLALIAVGLVFSQVSKSPGLAAMYLSAGALLALVGLILGIVATVKRTSKTALGVGGLVLSILAGLGVFSGMLPVLGRAREIAQMSMCAANMNAIGKGMMIYQAEADDASPTELEMLIENGSVPRACLNCPSVRQHPQPHYFYFPPPRGSAPRGATFILCDLKGNHPRDGRNVLTYGASVQKFRTEDEFQAALARPENAAFAAALKKADRP